MPENLIEEKETTDEERPVEMTIVLSLKRFPILRHAKIDDIIKALLRVKEISEEAISFEVVSLQEEKKKTLEEVEKDSQGSYKVRE